MKALIIEDEKPAVNRLIKLLHEVDTSITVIAVLDTIEDCVNWFSNKENLMPDILFMDIHLADGNSFEIFRTIKINVPVIFITAYDEYALNAFKVNSVDYLLKPVKVLELKHALEKLNTVFIHPQSENIKALTDQMENKYKDRFVIRLGNKLITVFSAQIAYFYSKDKMSFISDINNKHYPIDLSLDKIEPMLDPGTFFRINRQIIAAHQSIREIQTIQKSKLQITLSPPTTIESHVSSERSALFKKWLKKE